MKHFLIRYRLENGSHDQRADEIAAFITAVNDDPALSGRIAYRCMKGRDTADYYHLVTATDDEAVKTLQSRQFFSRYTDQTERAAAGGQVDVTPLELIAETAQPVAV